MVINMSLREKRAAELFDSGFNCAQSVVGAFCEDYGIGAREALRLAGGFGGGLRCGEVCGAVSGAVMVIGLKHGQSVTGDAAAKAECSRLTSEFTERFRGKNGTLLCRELLGYDVRDSGAREKFPGRQKEVCPKAISDAVALLEEMGF